MKEIYIVHVDDQIGAYRPAKHPSISYTKKENFLDFVEGLREDYPDHRLRCIESETIALKIRKQMKNEEMLKSCIDNQTQKV